MKSASEILQKMYSDIPDALFDNPEGIIFFISAKQEIAAIIEATTTKQ